MPTLTLGLFIMVTATGLVTGMIMMVPIMLVMMVAVMLVMVIVPLMMLMMTISSMVVMSNSGVIIMAFPVIIVKLISDGGRVMAALIVHVKTASLMMRFAVLVTKETNNKTRFKLNIRVKRSRNFVSTIAVLWKFT